MAIRVVLVEDDAELRKLTASILNFYPDIECVGAYESAEAFGEAFASLHPDVVLMDINLPRENGIDCVRKWKPTHRETHFVMLTSLSDPQKTFEALRAGATGYVLKPPIPDKIVEAIREVVSGGSPMSRDIARLVTEFFHEKEHKSPELEKLTRSEREVLQDLREGLFYKEIAAKRFVEISTVQTHVRHIYHTLQVHSRTEAVNKAFGDSKSRS